MNDNKTVTMQLSEYQSIVKAAEMTFGDIQRHSVQAVAKSLDSMLDAYNARDQYLANEITLVPILDGQSIRQTLDNFLASMPTKYMWGKYISNEPTTMKLSDYSMKYLDQWQQMLDTKNEREITVNQLNEANDLLGIEKATVTHLREQLEEVDKPSVVKWVILGAILSQLTLEILMRLS